MLSGEATAKDFISDAYAHAKFIAYVESAASLLEKAGLTTLDSGCLVLQKPADVTTFVQMCRKLRFWERESTVHAV
jgi:catalase